MKALQSNSSWAFDEYEGGAMTDGPAAPTSIVADISQHLGGVFRHMLPGILVIAGAAVAHPSWFRSIDFSSWQHLLALSVVAIGIGNTWFAFNRYGLYQLTDYILYRMRSLGPVPTGEVPSYLDDLGRFAFRSLHTPATASRARQHLAFRASTILLIFTVGEMAIVFGGWHGRDSVLTGSGIWLIAAGLIALGLGIWQEAITRRIDYYIVHPPVARNDVA
jgi:hypothetical protein